MRKLELLAVVVALWALPALAGNSASITVTISVEAYATVDSVVSPTMPPITRPDQTVDGRASFQVSTNHDVVAHLGRPGDALSGPGGRFGYGEPGAPLRWSANFAGLAVGQPLPISAGVSRLFQVEVQAATGHAWTKAKAGVYTGRLSLTLTDR